MATDKPESRYTVLRRLASGGMADVYLAVLRGAHGFEKQTIVKRMRPELADDEDYRRMFIDEARLMASLSHANIVSVLDFGEGDDGIFLALEYVDGLDLARLLRRTGTLPPAMAVYLGSCVLHALAYVHARPDAQGKPLHIVHRDVSPSNIFVGRNGDVKLGDFGVAKMARASARTLPGTIKGKIAYMAPEQAAALDVDERSDLFSMGIVLFEALTGQRPFVADTDVELLRQLIEEEAPDPRSVAPDLPKPLAGFLRTALARDRRSRFQSAEEMSRALVACAEGPLPGPSDVARLVAAHARTEDATPAVDPFAAALGLGPAEPTSPGALTETVRSRPNPVGARRWWAPLAVGAVALLAVLGGWRTLTAKRADAGPGATLGGPASLDAGAVAVVVPPPRPVAPGATDAGAEVALAPGDAGPLAQVVTPRAVDAGRPAPQGRATLDVNSTPWAKVYVDNKYVGDTALSGLTVAAGRRRLKLVNPSAGKTFETTLELSAGEHRVVPVDLERGVVTRP